MLAVVVATPAAMTSQYVTQEWQRALRAGTPVRVVLVCMTELPHRSCAEQKRAHAEKRVSPGLRAEDRSWCGRNYEDLPSGAPDAGSSRAFSSSMWARTASTCGRTCSLSRSVQVSSV